MQKLTITEVRVKETRKQEIYSGSIKKNASDQKRVGVLGTQKEVLDPPELEL